jgi:hypothetical protein
MRTLRVNNQPMANPYPPHARAAGALAPSGGRVQDLLASGIQGALRRASCARLARQQVKRIYGLAKSTRK